MIVTYKICVLLTHVYFYITFDVAAAAHPANATQAWYDEVNFYTYSSTECSDVCGHYTQVTWRRHN